jgi:hypothetical protein
MRRSSCLLESELWVRQVLVDVAVHRNIKSMQQELSPSEQMPRIDKKGTVHRKTCIGCDACPGTLRRCTQQYLCSRCRQAPEYKILSSTQLQNHFGLSHDLVNDLQVGWIINSVNPLFARQRVYYEKDVLKRVAVASSVLYASTAMVQESRNQDASDGTPSAGGGSEIQEDTR